MRLRPFNRCYSSTLGDILPLRSLALFLLRLLSCPPEYYCKGMIPIEQNAQLIKLFLLTSLVQDIFDPVNSSFNSLCQLSSPFFTFKLFFQIENERLQFLRFFLHTEHTSSSRSSFARLYFVPSGGSFSPKGIVAQIND